MLQTLDAAVATAVTAVAAREARHARARSVSTRVAVVASASTMSFFLSRMRPIGKRVHLAPLVGREPYTHSDTPPTSSPKHGGAALRCNRLAELGPTRGAASPCALSRMRPKEPTRRDGLQWRVLVVAVLHTRRSVWLVLDVQSRGRRRCHGRRPGPLVLLLGLGLGRSAQRRFHRRQRRLDLWTRRRRPHRRRRRLEGRA